jgi:hypothetical protein
MGNVCECMSNYFFLLFCLYAKEKEVHKDGQKMTGRQKAGRRKNMQKKTDRETGRESKARPGKKNDEEGKQKESMMIIVLTNSGMLYIVGEPLFFICF